MVEALSTEHRARDFVNENHEAKRSGAGTYMFIFYGMFQSSRERRRTHFVAMCTSLESSMLSTIMRAKNAWKNHKGSVDYDIKWSVSQ